MPLQRMDAVALQQLLESVGRGDLSVEAAIEKLRAAPPGQDLGFATLDHHRELRQGYPEVVYAPGKTPDQVAGIAVEIHRRSGRLLVTRADRAQAEAVQTALPNAGFDEVARTLSIVPEGARRTGVLLVCAGTADLPVLGEARVTCEYLGEEAEVLTDVGVAGIHRLLAHAEALRRARVVVVAAGMEGALPSVVGGLVAAPVIAVPTSVGYGAAFSGITPLLAMLNSCAPNVCCVNIDDGFGAAVVASLINRKPESGANPNRL